MHRSNDRTRDLRWNHSISSKSTWSWQDGCPSCFADHYGRQWHL